MIFRRSMDVGYPAPNLMAATSSMGTYLPFGQFWRELAFGRLRSGGLAQGSHRLRSCAVLHQISHNNPTWIGNLTHSAQIGTPNKSGCCSM